MEYCGPSTQPKGREQSINKIAKLTEKPRVRLLCDICGTFYSSMSSFLTHKESHLQIKRSKCDLCDKSFINKQTLRRHFLVHTGDRKFLCDICGSKFGQRESLYRHKKNVHFKKSVLCNICEKPFQTEESLTNHKDCFHKPSKNRTLEDDGNNDLKYTQQQMDDCKYCGRSYFGHKSMTAHVRTKHEKDKLLSCHICDRKFPFSYNLKKHIRERHGRTFLGPEKQKIIQCSKCKEVFLSVAALESHKPVCSLNIYHCAICKNSFSTSAGVKVHIAKKHLNTKIVVDHSCKICNKSFSRASLLKRHLRSGRCPTKRYSDSVSHPIKSMSDGKQKIIPTPLKNKRRGAQKMKKNHSSDFSSKAPQNTNSQGQTTIHTPIKRNVTVLQPFDLTSYIKMEGSKVDRGTPLKWESSNLHSVLRKDNSREKQNVAKYLTTHKFITHHEDSVIGTKHSSAEGEKLGMTLRRRTSIKYEDVDDLDEFEDIFI